MREHEVPTHVQAEDRVLLGFTFPQVVAVRAVFALSYGAYRYLRPGVEGGLVEMTLPDSPRSRAQRYRLTILGEQVRDSQAEASSQSR